MKYKKDANNDSISKIEENLLTQSDNQLQETYVDMHKQLVNDFIFENTRSVNTFMVEDLVSNRDKGVVEVIQDDSVAEVTEVAEAEDSIQGRDYLSSKFNRSKYTASFIDNESHREGAGGDLERFYEQKQSRIEEIITKRSSSTKRTNASRLGNSLNTSKTNVRPKTPTVNTANTGNTMKRSHSQKSLADQSKQSEKAKTITYYDFKAEEKERSQKNKINIKLKITNNSVEEIVDIKGLIKNSQKESGLFRRDSKNFRAAGSKPEANKSLLGSATSNNTSNKNIIKIVSDSNQPRQVKYNKTEPEIKGRKLSLHIEADLVNDIVNEIKTNMNKNLSVRKISLNDDKSLLTAKKSELSDINADRKRSLSL
jgi:hypothetical protein